MAIIEKLIDIGLHLDRYLGVIIQQYGLFTYLILFAVVFLETALVLTPFLPGDSLLFIAGTFAALKALNLWWLFFLLSIASIFGDTVNYWIGHYFGEKVFMKSRLFKKEYLDKTHEFYEKHGGKTIILARFIPIVRSFAPFVAGVSEMKYLKFLIYNVVGGILWVGIFLFAGYYFGGIQIVKDNITLMLLGIIFVSLIPPIVVMLKRNKDKLKWVVHKEYVYLLLLCIISLYFFLMITLNVFSNPEISLDRAVYESVKYFWNPGFVKVMAAVTNIADTLPVLMMSIIVLSYLLIRKRKYSATLFAASMISGLLLKESLKFIVMRSRPEGIIAETGYGFPSGHTTMSVIFFLLLIYLFRNDFKNVFLRWLFTGFFILLTIAIAASRVFLGVHWLTDVLGGIFLGLFCMSFFMVIVKAGRHYKGHIRKG